MAKVTGARKSAPRTRKPAVAKDAENTAKKTASSRRPKVESSEYSDSRANQPVDLNPRGRDVSSGESTTPSYIPVSIPGWSVSGGE